MANLGVPPASGEFTPMEDDMYEAFTYDVEEVPNTFYNPEVDKPNKATQFKWTLIVRDGEYKGRKMTYFTGSSIGRHPRNKLTNLVKIIDDQFDIDTAYADMDDFTERVINKPLRIVTTSIEKPDREDPTKTVVFNKIAGVMKSKLGKVNASEVLASMAEPL